MKRSEMLELLENFINLMDHSKPLNVKADAILSLVELHGMVPPKITILPDSYNHAEGEMGFKVHEWEEENKA